MKLFGGAREIQLIEGVGTSTSKKMIKDMKVALTRSLLDDSRFFEEIV